MWKFYYDKPSTCTNIWTWIYSSWSILEKKRSGGLVKEIVGSLQEEGTRIFGICLVLFNNEEARKYYES